MSGSAVTMFQGSNSTNMDNIGASKSWGHKKQENIFNNSFVGGNGKGVSYVSGKTRGTNDVQGEIVNTGIVSDIAIEGQGLMIVSESTNGERVFTRRGDFRQDQLGFWKNGSGMLLCAWKLDRNGDKPHNSSLLSSLETVNFANTKGAPKATNVLSIAMNLNSSQEQLRGPGVTASINRTGLNVGTTPSDIILPEQLSSGGISLGDEINFTSLSSGSPASKVIVFGGMAICNTPSVANKLFGSAKANDVFDFSGSSDLQVGHQLKIIVDGSSYTFTAAPGTANAEGRTFNSINTLKDAINRISGLTARVDKEGALYIAPVDPNKEVLFLNGANSTIKESLGLMNITKAQAGQMRFNSMSSLQKIVNANSELYSLKATIDNKGSVQVTSLLAIDDFSISGSATGKTQFTLATFGDNTEKGRGTVRISAPGNNFVEGDFVKISGMGNAMLPDREYSVLSFDSNGFTIAAFTTADNFPAANASPNITPAANASWQKIPGEKYDSKAGQITNSVAGAGGAVTVNFTNHGLQTNDVIQVKGGTLHVGGNDITLPDGYYVVMVVDADNFTINATNVTASLAFPAQSALSFRKIGATAGAISDVTENLMVTTGGVGSNQVKILMSSNNYQVGDYITLTGIDEAGVDIDGITVNAGVKYKVVTSDDKSVTFEVDEGVATTGDEVAGLKTRLDLVDLATNNISRVLEYLGIDQVKDTYTKNYDPNDVTKSLSGNNFGDTEVFTHPVQVFDSLGENFNLLLKFAKLRSNLWAVEVASTADANGEYEIMGVTGDGKLRSGTIEFDDNGRFLGGQGLNDALQITRRNGSAPSNIRIDWENELSAVKNGTVSQSAKANNVDIIQQDGQAAGTLKALQVDSDGYIVGTYDSGETRKLYQIPIGVFSNVNGLVAGASGTFRASNDSGDLLLKEAGIGGAGRTLGGVLEASNVDTTESLLEVQELSNTIRANARVVATQFQNIATILGELKG